MFIFPTGCREKHNKRVAQKPIEHRKMGPATMAALSVGEEE